MIHLFKSAAARTFTYSLMAIVGLGLLIGAVRLVLPFADLFRAHLAEALSETLGMEVRMSRFRLRLAGMVPRITLEDVDLLDADDGEPQLQLMRLHLDLDLAASILELAPQVESLTLEGASLHVERRADGTIAVAGLDGMERGNPQAITFFLANGRFLLTGSDIHWVDDLSEAPPLHLSDVQVRFDNDASRHRVGLRARLFDDPNTRLHLAADLSGGPGEPRDWAGELYLDWRGGNLQSLLAHRLLADIRLSSAQVEARSWNRIVGSQIVQSVTLLDLDGLRVWRNDPAGDETPLYVEHLGARMRWQQEENGWRIDVADLNIDRSSAEHPSIDLGVRFSSGTEGAWTVTAGVQALALADLGDALSLYAGPSKALQILHRANLDGDMRDLTLQIERRRGEKISWSAGGRVLGLSFEPQDRLPGMGELDARFQASADRGHLQFFSDDLVFDLPWLFEERNPLRFERLLGSLDWERTEDGTLHVASPALLLENADIRTRARLAIDLPPDGQPPRLDLYGELRDADATAIRRYLPGGKLKPRLEGWLDQAFLAGRVPWGVVLFQGRPRDFPFRNDEGRFEVLLRGEDAVLKLHRDWPSLQDVDAFVHFTNNRLDIDGARGRFLNNAVTGVHAEIPELLTKDKAVVVRGTASGTFSDGLRVLTHTPLSKRLGRLADIFHGEGMLRLDLSMSIPLRPPGVERRPTLTGALSWPGPATLGVAGTDLELSALRGALSFDQDSVTSSFVEAQLWDSPVKAELDSAEDGETGARSTRLALSGSTSVDTLSRHLPSPAWDHLRGKTGWRLDLDIPRAGVESQGLPLDFSLRSDLRGLGVALPAPLGKGKSAKRMFRLRGKLRPGQDISLRGRYADLAFHLRFARNEDGKPSFRRGSVVLGSSEAAPPRSDGLHLSGHLGELDLPAWTRTLGGSRSKPGGGPLRSADLRIDRLLLPGTACTNARVELLREPSSWIARVEAAELAGRVSVPHRPRAQPLRVELEQLDLKSLLPQADEDAPGNPYASEDPPGESDPRRSHTLDLSIERLLWGGNDLGRLTLRARARADGLDFTDIGLDGRPLMQLTGSGHWTIDGGNEVTVIDLQASGSDLGAYLRHLEYESPLDQAPADVRLHLGWYGSPTAFSVPNVTGWAEAEVGKGSLVDVDPGVGRMLGILNVGALKRRLSLDFSDLFERGYAFEGIHGKLKVHDGRAEIVDLVIDGPSAEIRIEGKTDLVKQELAQVVTVTPSLGTSVALVGAVAGGPLLGAAVLIADKVSGGAVDKIGRYRYDITGPWSDPKIERRPLAPGDADSQAVLPDYGRAGLEREPVEKPPTDAVTPGEGDTPGTERSQEPEPNLFLENH